MIGPGCLPRPWMWRTARKRTLPYTRVGRVPRRSSKTSAAPSATTNNEIVFDRGPQEFPVARLLPREPSALVSALLADLREWLVARWSWLRPRSLPALAAAVATVGVMVAADLVVQDNDCPAPHPQVELVSVQVVDVAR